MLKRFNSQKLVQVEQLIAYSQLLGLTGKDLVAIGGKMDRDLKRITRIANMEIIKGYECLSIGQDRPTARYLDKRFKLKTANGAYNFESQWTYEWAVRSLKTGTVLKYRLRDIWEYELPRVDYDTRSRYVLLLDISAGRLVLNF